MDTTKYIKIFAIVDLVLIFITIITSFMFESELPPLLQEYVITEAEAELTELQFALYIIVLIIAIVHIISLIGLIFIKRWSKNIYIYSGLSIFCFSPFFGPYVDHAIPSTTDDLSILVMGILISLLCFTGSAFNQSLKHGTAHSDAP